MEGCIPQKVNERPALKYLYRHVRLEIADNWYDIGVELLDLKDVQRLDIIKCKYPGDYDKCTAEMLMAWLDCTPSATWNQLLQALRNELQDLALKLEEMLMTEGPDVHQMTSNTQKMMLHNDSMQGKGEIDFTKLTIMDAFTSLMKELHRIVQDSPFEAIKPMCAHFTRGKFKDLVKETKTADDLFDLLEENPAYCSWMNTRLLEVIAISSNDKRLVQLIQNYHASVYSRSLNQVFEDLPNLKSRAMKLLPQYANLDRMTAQVLLPFYDKLL